jgi:hypothetical protein
VAAYPVAAERDEQGDRREAVRADEDAAMTDHGPLHSRLRRPAPIHTTQPRRSITMEVAIALILVATWTTICALKGKPGFAILGVLLFGAFGIVGAIRLAKPGSWWSRKFYGHHKLAKAWERFEATPYGEPTTAAPKWMAPPAAPERPEQPTAWLPPAAR